VLNSGILKYLTANFVHIFNPQRACVWGV